MEKEAPPKQLANAQESLNTAVRLLGDVRLGVDALDYTQPDHILQPAILRSCQQLNNAVNQLRSVGKLLEASGVMAGAHQRYEDNQPLASHMPLVASDGSVVAYSWKRQIAGQAAASAVERTALALKAFEDQMNRFMPQITSEESIATEESTTEGGKPRSLAETLRAIREEAPEMTIVTCGRPSRIEGGETGVRPEEAISLEVLVPDVFKAAVSLLEPGSGIPDAVAIFPVDESATDPWAGPSNRTFQKISECATNAMYVFRRSRASPLLALLQWLFSYRTLFTKPCRVCNRVIIPDELSNQLIPPTYRSYLGLDDDAAYHPECIQRSTESKY